MGLKIAANAAGPNDVRVVLEFEPKGELKGYSRVDMQFEESGRSRLFASLREEGTDPGHIVVSVAVDRANLDKVTLCVVTRGGSRQMIGYEIRAKDFVDLDTVH